LQIDRAGLVDSSMGDTFSRSSTRLDTSGEMDTISRPRWLPGPRFAAGSRVRRSLVDCGKDSARMATDCDPTSRADWQGGQECTCGKLRQKVAAAFARSFQTPRSTAPVIHRSLAAAMIRVVCALAISLSLEWALAMMVT